MYLKAADLNRLPPETGRYTDVVCVFHAGCQRVNLFPIIIKLNRLGNGLNPGGDIALLDMDIDLAGAGVNVAAADQSDIKLYQIFISRVDILFNPLGRLYNKEGCIAGRIGTTNLHRAVKVNALVINLDRFPPAVARLAGAGAVHKVIVGVDHLTAGEVTGIQLSRLGQFFLRHVFVVGIKQQIV